MVFLIKIIFGKGLCSRKLGKIGDFDTFVVNLMKFIPLFLPNCKMNTLLCQRSGQWKLFFKTFRGLNKNRDYFLKKTCFFVVSWTLGVRPIPAKNCNYIFKIAGLIPGLVFAQFLKPFCERSSSIIVQKTA